MPLPNLLSDLIHDFVVLTFISEKSHGVFSKFYLTISVRIVNVLWNKFRAWYLVASGSRYPMQGFDDCFIEYRGRGSTSVDDGSALRESYRPRSPFTANHTALYTQSRFNFIYPFPHLAGFLLQQIRNDNLSICECSQCAVTQQQYGPVTSDFTDRDE